MVVALGSPQPVFSIPPLEDIPDGEEDAPVAGIPMKEVGSMSLPEVALGAATFSHFYNSEAHFSGETPLRTIRLALRYGVNAFDTSPYYGVSEIVLGTALKLLATEFPRSSYKIMTKAGRYGFKQNEFDYSPATIRASVERSLERMHTSYLDTVYLHDVEYVCSPVGPAVSGNPHELLESKSAEYGLAEGQEGKIWGEGDQKILDAVAELRKLQEEGKVKNIGISALPLTTLLRLALLVLHNPPYKPLDVMLSYVHVSLQNSLYATHAAAFRDRAKVGQLVTASPLCMGLLTSREPAPWHPAPPAARKATQDAATLCTAENWEGGLAGLATGFAFAKADELAMPVVVGLSNPREVHEAMAAWRAVRAGKDAEKRIALEKKVADMFGEMQGWMWESPDPKALVE